MANLISHFPSTFHSPIISGNNNFPYTAGGLSITDSKTEDEIQFLNERGNQEFARW